MFHRLCGIIETSKGAVSAEFQNVCANESDIVLPGRYASGRVSGLYGTAAGPNLRVVGQLPVQMADCPEFDAGLDSACGGACGSLLVAYAANIPHQTADRITGLAAVFAERSVYFDGSGAFDIFEIVCSRPF